MSLLVRRCVRTRNPFGHEEKKKGLIIAPRSVAVRPVELINNGVFTATDQPLKLKTFTLRLKGY